MPTSGDNCSWTQERIESYVDGELHGAELEAFERHIESCETCRGELSLAGTLVRELRALPPLGCPDRVVEDAAARVGAESTGTTGTWVDRLRERFGGRFAPVPKPVVAVVLLVIVAAVFVLLQHEQLPFTGTGELPTEVTVTDEELELAKLDVMLAFAYVGKYSLRTSEIVIQDGITDRVMKTLGKTVIEPMYPFPLDE